LDFDQDICDYVLSVLPCDPSDLPILRTKKRSELLIIYFNWLERLVYPTKRAIHESSKIDENPLVFDPRYKAGLDEIKRKILAGEELTPHLSRSIRNGFQQSTDPKKLNRRQDLDLMLSAWKIHHLHLSADIENDGFVERTGALLFAIFQPKDAYLVDIVEHGGWTKKHVIETVVKEWPSRGIVHEIKGSIRLSQSYTENEHAKIRNAGLNSAIECDGKVWMTATGTTSAGTSLTATLEANKISHRLREFRAAIRDDPEWIVKRIKAMNLPVPKQTSLKFVFAEGGYGIVEENAGLFFRLSS